jgi:membrane protease YdiL (CAAX protease family)
VTGRSAWTRLVGATAVAIALVVSLSPPGPPLRLPVVAAAPAGLLAGAALSLAVRRGASAASRPSLAVLALLAVSAANEELIWRRVLAGELLRAGALAALAGSTVLFALAHRGRPGLHLATGGLFGGLYLATGALTAAVAAHWAYNTGLAVGGEVP